MANYRYIVIIVCTFIGYLLIRLSIKIIFRALFTYLLSKANNMVRILEMFQIDLNFVKINPLSNLNYTNEYFI